MVSQRRMSETVGFNLFLYFSLLALGVIVGGVIALIGLSLWSDYHTNASSSRLAVMSAQVANIVPASLKDLLILQAQLMGLPLAERTSAYWYMARAGGIVSYLLLWLSTVWGLILSTKMVTKLISAPVIYGLHEFLSILTILFAVIHAVVLLGDKYIKFNIFHLVIPFTAPYEPFWTGLGTVGLYLSAVMVGSFYVRKVIGQRLWRSLHFLTFGAYLLVLIHALMSGTDSGLTIMQLIYLGTGLTVLFFIYVRLFTARQQYGSRGR